jgi:hypothetical protein
MPRSRTWGPFAGAALEDLQVERTQAQEAGGAASSVRLTPTIT